MAEAETVRTRRAVSYSQQPGGTVAAPVSQRRKSYQFSKNDSGAVDNTIFYSLIESCDLVGVEPLKWLTDVLTYLHDGTSPQQIRQMLSYYYKKSQE